MKTLTGCILTHANGIIKHLCQVMVSLAIVGEAIGLNPSKKDFKIKIKVYNDGIMKKTYLTFGFFVMCLITGSAQFLVGFESLPQPKNDRLYSEFTARRSAPYLKRPLLSSGYIAMNGKDKFIFKQTKPSVIEVRKKEDRLTLKINNNAPMEINSNSNGDNISFIFDSPENLEKYYDITKTSADGNDEYQIVPKTRAKVDRIILTGIGDIILTIDIFFTDKSDILFEFKNTKTGTAPDEKYF
jgi:hypothetical protein